MLTTQVVRTYTLLSSTKKTLLKKRENIKITLKIKNMPIGLLAGAAIGLGSQLLGAGGQAVINGAVAKGNSKRALRQQRAYTDIATQANERIADYNQKLAFDSLEKGYGFQMQGLKNAGLNPALMYGTSGGGGTTTAPAQGVSTGSNHGETDVQAPNVQMAIQNGLNLAMQEAQINNLNANTEKAKAEAHKTAGVDTEEATSRIHLNEQSVQSQKAQQALTETNNRIAKIQEQIQGQSAESQIQIVQLEMQKLDEEWRQLVRVNEIGDKTYNTAINQIRANLAATLVENRLKEQQISLTAEQKNKVTAEIQLLDKQLNWYDINQEQEYEYISKTIDKIRNDIGNADTPDSWKAVQNALSGILGGAMHGASKKPNNNTYNNTSTHTHEHTHF